MAVAMADGIFSYLLSGIIIILVFSLFYLAYRNGFIVGPGGQQGVTEGFTGAPDQFSELDVKLRDKIFGDDSEIYAFDVKQIANKIIGDRDYSGLKILDAGTGIGRHYSEFARIFHGADITGVDRSSNMIQYARNRNPEGKFINDDLLKQDLFKPDTFDYVFAMLETIFYNKDVRGLVENVHRWLKPGGVFCVHLINPEKLDPAPRPYTQYYEHEGVKHALTYYNGFAHDAVWERNGDETDYVQSYILDDGNKTTSRLKLYIPNQQQMVKMIQSVGFKVIDIISLRPLKIEDFELFCFQKPGDD